jgi:hypothetical protein
MSFALWPYGLAADSPLFFGDADDTFAPPYSTLTITCPTDVEGLSSTATVPDEFTGHLDWPVAAAVAVTDAAVAGTPPGHVQYYAVRLTLFNSIGTEDGGYTACRTPPESGGYDSSFTGWEDGHATFTPDGTTSIVNPDGTPGTLPNTSGVYLVNPGAPGWPSPDAYGNVAGELLFTYAELQTATAGFDYDIFWAGFSYDPLASGPSGKTIDFPVTVVPIYQQFPVASPYPGMQVL